MILLLWVIRAVLSGQIRIRKTNMNIPIVVYFCYTIFYFAVSPNQFATISEAKRIIICFAVYFLTVNSISVVEQTRNLQLKIIFIGFITGSSIIMLYGFMQHFEGINISGFITASFGLERVSATFGNPIYFAAFLVILLPVVLGFFFYSHASGRNAVAIMFAGIFIAGLITLYYTKTRASWIGIAASIALFGLLNINSTRLKRYFFISFGAAGVVFVALPQIRWVNLI